MKKTLAVMMVFFLSMCLGSSALAGQLTIKGSTTVLPITQEVGEAFMKQYPDINLSISGGGSGNGIKAMIDGTTNIAQSSRWIKDSEVKMAVDNGHFPVAFAVALDSIIPVVHPESPVDELSMEQLRGIYNGNITNWKEVGGQDRKIMVISRDSSSGTYGVWVDNVLKGDRVTPRAQLLASNGAIVQAIQDNPHAIGYIGIGYMTDKLKSVVVDGIKPTPETTASGDFPVSRYLWVFTDGWPSGDTLKFINFLQNPEKGQRLVEKTGYVPLY